MIGSLESNIASLPFLKKLCFPVKRHEWLIFGLMFFIVSLININFNILRSMRNTLVVGDVGGSAAFIPYFELFGMGKRFLELRDKYAGE